MRRTVPPSAEIQASIDKLLSRGMVDDPQKMSSELARLGARLIIQRAVEDEFDTCYGQDVPAGPGSPRTRCVSGLAAGALDFPRVRRRSAR